MQVADNELHRVAITAIIYNDEGKYLLTRRSLEKKVFPGKWTVPGGGLEVADYINTPPTHPQGQWYSVVEQALRREVKEEVHLEIEKPEYLLDLTFIRPDGIPVLVLSYCAKYQGGEVQLDADSSEHAWVTLAEARQYDLIDGIIDELEIVDALLTERRK